MSDLRYSDSIVIARTAGDLYDMVSDVTRMGEWSPVCRSCRWDDGAGRRVGAGFTGRNETPDRDRETHSVVEVAQPGREFAFVVNGGWTRWGYTFEPVEAGTRVTESWQFLPAGQQDFRERFGADADSEIDKRRRAAREGIPQTLAAIKTAAEAH